MARIEEISVKNYRVMQNITLKDIKPFSVFLGPNGSGKTTFFDVIGFLSDCLTTNVRKALEKRGRFQEVISRDCQELKRKLCDASSVVTKHKGNIVLHRIAVEELEPWFIGDVTAIRAEYEKIPVSLSQQAKFRNPDTIKGGTWEQLDKILKKYGYETGLQKINFAEKVSPHMDVENNLSRSFQIFRDGLRSIVK